MAARTGPTRRQLVQSAAAVAAGAVAASVVGTRAEVAEASPSSVIQLQIAVMVRNVLPASRDGLPVVFVSYTVLDQMGRNAVGSVYLSFPLSQLSSNQAIMLSAKQVLIAAYKLTLRPEEIDATLFGAAVAGG